MRKAVGGSILGVVEMTHIFVWRFEDVFLLVAMALFLVFAAGVLLYEWWRKRK